MSNGVQHGLMTQTLAAASVPVTAFLSRDLKITLLVACGVMVGLVMEPDLDVVHRTKSEARVASIHPILGLVWYWFWLPYAKAIPHRSWVSHLPIVGTGLRVLYLTWIPMVIYVSLGNDLSTLPIQDILWVCLGLAASDLAHWGMDVT